MDLEELIQKNDGNEYRKLLVNTYCPQWVDEYLKVHIFLPESMKFNCDYNWLHFSKEIEQPMAWIDRGYPMESPLIKF